MTLGYKMNGEMKQTLQSPQKNALISQNVTAFFWHYRDHKMSGTTLLKRKRVVGDKSQLLFEGQ